MGGRLLSRRNGARIASLCTLCQWVRHCHAVGISPGPGAPPLSPVITPTVVRPPGSPPLSTGLSPTALPAGPSPNRSAAVTETVPATASSHAPLVALPPAANGYAAQGQSTVVITSWALLAVIGSFQGKLAATDFPWLVTGFRNALADSLDVCRPSVSLTSLRATDDFFTIADPPPRSRTWGRARRAGLLADFMRLMRSNKRRQDGLLQHINLTQVKIEYEVRIFPAMRVDAAEICHRIDSLQVYSRFSEFNRMVAARIVHEGAQGAMVDDTGNASRWQLERPPLAKATLDDCIEEGLLHDARETHTYVVAVCLVLILLLTCIGSTVFAVKTPSRVPSRLNPLVEPDAVG